MAISIITALGTSQLRTGYQPRQMQRVYHGFPGVHGLTVMAMGARGYAVPIVGTLAVSGQASYAAARAAIRSSVLAVEALQSLGAADYTYGNDLYAYCIWENFRLLGIGDKAYRWDGGGKMMADFAITLRSLI